MKDDIKVIITLGFSTILVLMFALVFVALRQMQVLDQRISALVEETNAKMEAAYAMRDAIRLRSDALKSIQLTTDMFEQDEERMKFIEYSGQYRQAREQLLSKAMNAREREVHKRLSQLTRQSQPYNERAVELLIGDAPASEVAAVLDEATHYRNTLLDVLDELVMLERSLAVQALDEANKDYFDTRQTMIFLAAVALLICGAIASLVIRRASQKNRKISYQASHDELTGLLNRRAFECELKTLFQQVDEYGGEHVLLYLDLDQFKIINDTCGHKAGDDLLSQLTCMIANRLRKSDVIARLGGDEFGVLLKDCPLPMAIQVAENLRMCVEKFRFSWEARSFSLGVSIGAVPVVKGGGSLTETLSLADMACLVAKQEGRNRVHIAGAEDHHIRRHRGEMEWVGRIQDGLEQNRFELYGQCVVAASADSDEPPHIELLVRMLDADGGIIMPGAFIPAAERYGLMSQVDRWVFSQAVAWMERRPPGKQMPRLMINLSGQTLCDAQFLQYALDTLENSRVSARQLCFEVTETAAIANLTKAITFIETLKARGCEFALDDFGSGLSSFSYLKQLPVDYLKIDGAFVKDIVEDPIDFAMVKSINDIGHVMGKRTIAEFVENDAIRRKLEAVGVDYLQGYAIHAPQPLRQLDRSATRALTA